MSDPTFEEMFGDPDDYSRTPPEPADPAEAEIKREVALERDQYARDVQAYSQRNVFSGMTTIDERGREGGVGNLQNFERLVGERQDFARNILNDVATGKIDGSLLDTSTGVAQDYRDIQRLRRAKAIRYDAEGTAFLPDANPYEFDLWWGAQSTDRRELLQMSSQLYVDWLWNSTGGKLDPSVSGLTEVLPPELIARVVATEDRREQIEILAPFFNNFEANLEARTLVFDGPTELPRLLQAGAKLGEAGVSAVKAFGYGTAAVVEIFDGGTFDVDAEGNLIKRDHPSYIGQAKGHLGDTMDAAFMEGGAIPTAWGGLPEHGGFRDNVAGSAGSIMAGYETTYKAVEDTLSTVAAGVSIAGVNEDGSVDYWIPSRILEKDTWREARGVVAGDSETERHTLGETVLLMRLTENLLDDKELAAAKQTEAYQWAIVIDIGLGFTRLDPVIAASSLRLYTRARRYGVTGTRIPDTASGWANKVEQPHIRGPLEAMEGMSADAIFKRWFPNGGDAGLVVSNAFFEAKDLVGRQLVARHFATDQSAWRQLRDQGYVGAAELIQADIQLAKEVLSLNPANIVDNATILSARRRSFKEAVERGYLQEGEFGSITKLPQGFIDDMDKIAAREAATFDAAGSLTEFPRQRRVRGAIVRETSTDWYQNSWYTRPIRVLTDRLPQSVVSLDEAMGIREFGRSFNGSHVPSARRQELMARYAKETTTTGRRALWEEGKEAIRDAIAGGNAETRALLVDAKETFNRGRGANPESIYAANAYAETYLGSDGAWVHSPMLKSQMENYWFGRETAWIMKADSALGRYRLRGQLLIENSGALDGAKAYARVMNTVERANRVYKTTLLLRPAWTLRVGMDEQARSWARLWTLVGSSLDDTGLWQVRRARRSVSMIPRTPKHYEIRLGSGRGARSIRIDPATADDLLKARSSSAGVSGMAHQSRIRGVNPLERTRAAMSDDSWRPVNLADVDFSDVKAAKKAADQWERVVNGQFRYDSMARQILAGRNVEEILRWMNDDPTGIRYAAHADTIRDTRAAWVQAATDEIRTLVPIELRPILLERDLLFRELRDVFPDDSMLPRVHAQVAGELSQGPLSDGVMPLMNGAVDKALEFFGSRASDRFQRHPMLNALYFFEAKRQARVLQRQIAKADRLRTGALTLDTGEAVRLVADDLKTIDGVTIYTSTLDDIVGMQYLDAENIHQASFRPEQLTKKRALRLEEAGYDAIYFADAMGHGRDFYIPLRGGKMVDSIADLERLPNTLSMADVYRIERNAKEWALNEMKFTLYDLAESGQAAEILRLIIPFYNAWEEVLTRWAGMIYENPAIAAKTANAFRSAEALSHVVNEHGELVTWDEAGADGRILVYIPDFVKHYFPNDALETIGNISFDQDGFSMLNNIIPLAGGPVQLLAAKVLLEDRPDIVEATSFFHPYGIETDPARALTPAYIRRILDFRDKDSRAYVTVMMSVFRDLHIQYQQFSGDEDFEALTAESTANMMDEAKRITDDLLPLKILSSFGSPMPLAFESVNKFYIDALRDGQERYYEDPMALRDPDTGEERTPDIWFLDTYGNEYAILLESSSESLRGMPSTMEAFTSLEKFGPMMRKYPEMVGLILGGEGGVWSGAVHDWQFANDERAIRDFEEFAEAPDIRLGWMELNALNAEWEARRLANPVYKVNRTKLENDVYNSQVQDIKDAHPIWAEAYAAGGDRGFQERQLRNFREIANDPLMADRVEWDGAREFIELVDMFDEELASIGAAHIGSQESHDLLMDQLWENELLNLLDDNPLFSGMYYRYFENIEPKAKRYTDRVLGSADDREAAEEAAEHREEVKAELKARQEAESNG